MNAGFSNLKSLKEQILAPVLRAQSNYDASLLEIGKGAAGFVEYFCNRHFQRVENATDTFEGGREGWVLERYPVESIAKLEYKEHFESVWVEQPGAIASVLESAGLVRFCSLLGVRSSLLRITYTGGYWWDTSDTGDQPMPAGATALPDPVRTAWLLTVRKVWESIDKQGSNVTKVGSGATFVTESLGGLDVVPQVREMLRPFIRYQCV
jgi:hypothetical protein